jgi:hypothetical protein
MAENQPTRHCIDHGQATACLGYAKKEIDELKTDVLSAHKRLDGMVSMKIFGILISVLLLVFTALFGLGLKTNAGISDLCVELRGMQRDISVNTRDIDTASREIRHLKRGDDWKDEK